MRSASPRPRRLIARERLFALIDAARSGRALWIAGEAGSGKTSLMTSYLADRALPTIWYRVSAADSDLPTFFHYFGEAVRTVRPRMVRPLPHLTPEYLPSVAAFAKRYFAQALGGLKPPFVIVLDELQGPALNSPLADIVVSAIEHLPEGALLAVLSRSAPPSAFARLVANSTLALVGAAQMRFSEPEARALAETLGREDERLIAECIASTRGWAAGLVLLLQVPAADVPATLRPQQVMFDYFAAELLERADPETQVLLMKTALLPLMTGEEAAALCGNPRAGQLLLRLARENAFVYQDQAGIGFEYHPLFREFLIARARSELPQTDVERVEQEAARVLESSGRHEAAADIYLRNRDWQRLSALVIGVAPLLLSQGRWRPVNEWISAMPLEHVEQSADLLYWKGMSQIPPAPAAARIPLSQAYERAVAANEQERALLACCGVLEAYGTEVNDFRGADVWVERLDSLLPKLPDEIPPHVEMRLALAMEAVKWCRPQHALMKRWVERAHRQIVDAPAHIAVAYAYAAIYYDSWLGEHHRCGEMVPVGRRFADVPHVPPLLRIAWCAIEWCYHCFVADFEAARAAARQIDDISAEFGLYVAAGMLHSAHAYIGLASGDTEAAFDAIERAARDVNLERRLQACHCYYLRSQVALARGELSKALDYARTGLQWLESVSAPFPVAVGKLAAAQVFIEHGEYSEAAALNEEGRRFALAFGSAGLAWHADLNDAYLRLHRGDRRAAEAFLRQALSLARSKGAIVWDISMPTRIAARLAEAALEAGIEVDYVRDVIRRRRLNPESEYVEGWPWPVRILSLGRFELLINGERVESASKRKASHQPLALLKTVLALGGRGVDANTAAKHLWPGGSAEDAENALKTTLHRLRRRLGREDAMLMQDNKLSINPKACWWDADAFERLVARSAATVADGERSSEFERIAEQALALYGGAFLASDGEMPGVAARRERLRQQFYRLVSQFGGYYERHGRWDAAERIYRRALEMEPLAEAFYRQLILCLKRQGRHADALDIYYRCRDVLKAELGAGPSAETRALIDSTRLP